MRGAPQEAFRTYISSNHPLQHEVQLEILSILICSLQLDADGSRWREPICRPRSGSLMGAEWEPNVSGSRNGSRTHRLSQTIQFYSATLALRASEQAALINCPVYYPRRCFEMKLHGMKILPSGTNINLYGSQSTCLISHKHFSSSASHLSRLES